ncbi:GTPase Era [bacterium]|nr:GTPase Era [bacterium]
MTGASPGYRAGFVAVTGMPNVGKSTLLNALVGESISIVTPKPQTTRRRIVGILQRDEAQIVFFDTPGLAEEISALNKFLNVELRRTVGESDIAVLVVDAGAPLREAEAMLCRELGGLGRPLVLAVNKCDLVRDDKRLSGREAALSEFAKFDAVIRMTATKRDGVDELVDAVLPLLPEGAPMYPEDEITSLPVRFFVAEMIREQLFLQTRQEIPYSTDVVVEHFKEPEEEGGVVRIEAEIYVERESQKGIVIGKGGLLLKSIGQAARAKIEEFLGQRVYLGLFVKVRKDWTQRDEWLRRLGYHP